MVQNENDSCIGSHKTINMCVFFKIKPQKAFSGMNMPIYGHTSCPRIWAKVELKFFNKMFYYDPRNSF